MIDSCINFPALEREVNRVQRQEANAVAPDHRLLPKFRLVQLGLIRSKEQIMKDLLEAHHAPTK